MKFLIIIQFLLISTISFTQNKEIKNLVFEGAGIRGIAYAGVLKSLEEHKLSEDIEKVGGTSAGAIFSLLYALGYTSDEMVDIISNTRFRKFNDGKFIFIGGFFRTKDKYGWYRGNKFKEWLGDLIEEKTNNSDISFEDLHNKGFKDLYVTATCLNKQKMIVLSYETYPKMKVKDAVRISMSIPLYYQAVFVDSIGNTYSKQNKENSLDIMVDGGIIGNFPIQIFDTYEPASENKQIRVPNFETIGVRIDSESQIKEDKNSRELANYDITNFRDYISALYIIVIENLNRNYLTDEDWVRTISVSSVGISPKVKKLSKEQKEKLVNSGEINTEKYLSVNHFINSH